MCQPKKKYNHAFFIEIIVIFEIRPFLKKNEDFLKKVSFLREKNQKKHIIGIEGQTSPLSTF